MFGPALMHSQLLDVADEYPDTTFALIDSNAAPVAPNVIGVNFAVEQGSFLVGAAAALESATGKVGYIGANALSRSSSRSGPGSNRARPPPTPTSKSSPS